MTSRALPLLALLPVMLLAGGASLPEDGPVPLKKPAEAAAPAANTEGAAKADPSTEPAAGDVAAPDVPPTEAVPTPKEKPAEPAPSPTDAKPQVKPAPDTPAAGEAQPGDGTKREAAPSAPPKADGKPEAAPEQKPDAAPPVALTIEPEDSKAYAQCLADLKAMGATFEERPRIDEGKGCGIDKPLDVTAILPGVDVKPKATIRCETALELARWTREAVLPAASTAVPDDGALTTLNQASSYICRLRNNAATGKISEHARGNAIDIASFTFKSGKTIAIQPRDEDGTLTGAFQRAVTATGCLYFETVLDPGSDEAHENHLHFDVLQRRGGYRYCR
ncbi:extensin family protein [Rhizobium sp. YIM 134829]|uniref:extensin-like domain-containing protein n=1 Tax=Rhizobium sp. YIM 134829 TaxID=3390453 RepID=UPI003979CDD9